MRVIKTTALLASAAGLMVFSGCSSHQVMIEKAPPSKYEKLGEARGEGTGSLGLAATAYYFVPMGLNSRSEKAYDNALASVPGATGLMNVTYQEDWLWWVLGTARTVKISGDAIKEVK